MPKRFLNFCGELFEEDPEEGSLKISIRVPMDYAKRVFKWNRCWGADGVGINTEALQYAKDHHLRLLVEANGELRWALADDWIQFCIKQGTGLQVKNSVIYVYPWDLMERPAKTSLRAFL
jgi:hypothetical protein